MFKSILTLTAGTLALAGPAFADFVITDDLATIGNACIGDDCVNGEAFDPLFDAHLRIKGSAGMIEFFDISGASSPDRDWRIRANELSGGSAGEAFFIEDLTESTNPFYIEGGAPSDALRVFKSGDVGVGGPNNPLYVEGVGPNKALHVLASGDIRLGGANNPLYVDRSVSGGSIGRVGINTQLPASALHVMGGALDTSIRLENSVANRFWKIQTEAGFGNLDFIHSGDTTSTPFRISHGAPVASLFIKEDGRIGMGTPFPAAQLELSSVDSFNFFRITAQGAAVNDSVDFVFTNGPLGTGQLRYNIVEAGDSPQVPEMTLDAEGNMVLTGTLTTSGPTCTGGCDRVFDDDYALPSIPDHAEAMFAAGYLPAVGPTVPQGPVNLGERQGQMLNALEHAHIYIAKLHDDVTRERDLNAEQTALITAQQRMIEDILARLDDRG